VPEERANECGAVRHLGKLRGNAISQTFALRQGPTCVAGALRMAPDQLIGIEVWGVAGQVMHRQLAGKLCDVFRDRACLVGWQSSKDEMQGFASSEACKINCVTGYHASSREEGGFDDQARYQNGCVAG